MLQLPRCGGRIVKTNSIRPEAYQHGAEAMAKRRQRSMWHASIACSWLQCRKRKSDGMCYQL